MNFGKPYILILALALMAGCAGRKNRLQVPAGIQTPPTAIQVWRPLGFAAPADAEVRLSAEPPDSGQASAGATPAPESEHEAAGSLAEPQVVPPPHKPRKKALGKAPRPGKAPHREPAPVASPTETTGADKSKTPAEGGGLGAIGLALLPLGAAAAWLTGRAVAQALSKRGG